MKLLNVDSNAKTVKGQKKGFLTGILYLAPYTLANRQNVCQFATNGCKKSCLYFAGRGAFNNVQSARIRKTQMFFDDREIFLHLLKKDIEALIRKANKLNLIPVIRLNGTSDINWEKVYFNENIKLNVFELFSDVQFYDYTKDSMKFYNNDIPNYHLTFSLSEDTDNNFFHDTLTLKNKNISVVFQNDLPDRFLGYEVINGDLNDLRFLDKPGTIVGLSAKGKAKKDQSGFVVKGESLDYA